MKKRKSKLNFLKEKEIIDTLKRMSPVMASKELGNVTPNQVRTVRNRAVIEPTKTPLEKRLFEKYKHCLAMDYIPNSIVKQFKEDLQIHGLCDS